MREFDMEEEEAILGEYDTTVNDKLTVKNEQQQKLLNKQEGQNQYPRPGNHKDQPHPEVTLEEPIRGRRNKRRTKHGNTAVLLYTLSPKFDSLLSIL